MYQTILIPLDGSNRAEAILDHFENPDTLKQGLTNAGIRAGTRISHDHTSNATSFDGAGP